MNRQINESGYAAVRNNEVIRTCFSYDTALRVIESDYKAWPTAPDLFRDDDGNRYEIKY